METTYDGEIDAFIVRFPQDDSLYWADIEDVGGHETVLRYEAAIDRPPINWAEDFELGEEIPSRD